MPVTRYRDVSEMPPPPRAKPEELTRRIRSLWRRVVAFAPPSFPRGVQRFRSIEEAQAAREAAHHHEPVARSP
ncbi:MAG: hypothetical protein ABIO70_07085 [Pseudomonadota bacterium]